MWANAQRDGRPAEHRWRPLFNDAKFCWGPLQDAVQWRCQDAKPVEICRGAPNYRIDLIRQWAEAHHIVRTCGGHIFCCLTSFFSNCRYVLIIIALCNRADHYIFIMFLSFFLSSFFLLFLSSPNLSGRRLDVYHTSAHGVALVQI